MNNDSPLPSPDPINGKLTKMNRLVLMTIRDLAQSDRTDAAVRFGLSEAGIDWLLTMDVDEIDALAESGLPLFAPTPVFGATQNTEKANDYTAHQNAVAQQLLQGMPAEKTAHE